jgi:hypothetical protein
MAKLTPENRKWIVEMWKTGKYTQKELADNSDVSIPAVNHILRKHLLTTPQEHKNKCLACGKKMRPRVWEAYKICGHQHCAQAYGEAAECRQHDGDKYTLVQPHFWAPITDWSEIHYKGAGYDRRIKEYCLFHSQREHIGYHWGIIEHGLYEFSEGKQILRRHNFKPIWDGVENEEGQEGWYRPAPDRWDR